jgi:uncharacterized membrane protein
MTRKSTRRAGGAKRAAGPANGLTRWVRRCPPHAGAALRRGSGHAEPAAGNTRWLWPSYGAGALCAVVAAAVVTAITAAFAQAPGPPTDGEILALMRTHCVACHAVEPTHPAFAKAPAGVLLETIPQIAANAARIMTQVVVNRAMPLGNETGMTDEERDRIAAWIESRNK